MIKNYLLSSLRNFKKSKGFSMLNVFGLALGIAASLLIIQYVSYEVSYDQYHTKSDRIYRIQYNSYSHGEINFECAAAVPAVGPAMKENFSEIEEFARLLPGGGLIAYKHPVQGLITYRERNNIQVTEPSIFNIFDINFNSGVPESCIDATEKIAISESAAKKYFGDEDPIGQLLTFNGDLELAVTAVFEDVPANSHIKFDFLVSNKIFFNQENDGRSNWGWYDHNTYVVLQEGVDHVDFQAKWDKYLKEVRAEDWDKYDYRQEFILQPLTDIHLYSNLLQESRPEEQGDGESVYFLTIVAFFILLIAWVNYINLSTAKSMERANEVGVRKVMGAYRSQLMKQFLTESFLLNLIASVLGLLIVLVVWPYFTDLTGRSLELTMVTSPTFWGTAILLFILGTLGAGFYPALVISSFKPVTVLKGKIFKTNSGAFLRQSLVVFQFTVSIILISGTIMVLQQLNFMKNKDLGINIKETMVINGPGAIDSTYRDKLESFHGEVTKISGIKNMTAASNVPGNEIFWTRDISRLSGNTDVGLVVYNVGIDHHYIPAFDLEILAGRNFQKEMNDGDKVILNKSLCDVLDYSTPDEAIGEKVVLGGDTMEIAGIISDYHQMSLRSQKAPLVFRLETSNTYLSFKMNSPDYQVVLAEIENVWKQFFPGNPIDYFFLDEFFNKQYDRDRQFSQVFTIFSMLAIFVACMGLFGLASFLTSQRTKEIGIRKVLGSTVQGIVTLLSSGFVRLVLVSNLVAIPIAWWLMDQWLQSFPYHIEVSPMAIVGSGLIVICIALISVSYQTVKAALLNPAETLRYE